MSRNILFCNFCIFKMLQSAAEPQMAHPYYQIGLSNIMYMSILFSNVIGDCVCCMCFNHVIFLLCSVYECAM